MTLIGAGVTGVAVGFLMIAARNPRKNAVSNTLRTISYLYESMLQRDVGLFH